MANESTRPGTSKVSPPGTASNGGPELSVNTCLGVFGACSNIVTGEGSQARHFFRAMIGCFRKPKPSPAPDTLMLDYVKAKARLEDARRRGDTRDIHTATVEIRRLMTLRLRREAGR